ncbi:uncharacterized protein LOC132621965 isoform X2 [Lycium barbarum]|uniref:uncharacterized protein LOC132621965 isoform X2 n=1 Tax=Lycium barbarum TaxID=112863 RepID=UPI00293E2EA7|nr:uncharacterized protein LOC132621965 isoform X2 [Lycium barbarum]XP_060192446.1 uncharacterized protein LOC132621965 isoform X2 [Lycium barbarum]
MFAYLVCWILGIMGTCSMKFCIWGFFFNLTVHYFLGLEVDVVGLNNRSLRSSFGSPFQQFFVAEMCRTTERGHTEVTLKLPMVHLDLRKDRRVLQFVDDSAYEVDDDDFDFSDDSNFFEKEMIAGVLQFVDDAAYKVYDDDFDFSDDSDFFYESWKT